MNRCKIFLVFLLGVLFVVCVRAKPPLSAEGGFSAQEVEYFSAVKEVRVNYAFFTAELRARMNVAGRDWWKPPWQQEVEAALLGWEVTGKYVRSLDPPAGYEDLHQELVEISYEYEKCAKLTRLAFGLDSLLIERVDFQKLEKATQVAERIKSFWRKLDSYLEDIFQKLPGEFRQDNFEGEMFLASETNTPWIFLTENPKG